MKYLPKILIVDDELDYVTHSAALLRKSGFDVYSLIHADEVFDIVERYKPDVVVIDIRLGTHDGRTICRQIKNSGGSKLPKVILQSFLPEFGNEYQDYGADDFLLKPITLDQLVARINHHLQQDKDITAA